MNNLCVLLVICIIDVMVFFLFCLLVKICWNFLMPMLGFEEITNLQAVCGVVVTLALGCITGAVVEWTKK